MPSKRQLVESLASFVSDDDTKLPRSTFLHYVADRITADLAVREKEGPRSSIVIKVHVDDDPMSPLEFDNLGVIATWHRGYNLGHVQPKCSPEEWLKDNAPPGSVVLPVYMYEHSGIALSTGSFGDPWDSGQLGVIVATPDAIRKNFMKKRISKKMREITEKILKSEISTYNDYVSGNVWGFTIEDEEDPSNEDSCWGFFGDDLEGMKGHVSKELHPLLEKAWEDRFNTRR